ncbi:MAG: methylated-DNA--[protein]-cysteine S-methyltransferase [Acidovorax sp.]|nr:methylated-DNA--[protein]-cysteine S-methyltransferase [Acidovorax sp.]
MERMEVKIDKKRHAIVADTPLGSLLLVFTFRGLASISFIDSADLEHWKDQSEATKPSDAPPLAIVYCMDLTKQELSNYFDFISTSFRTIPLDLQGTAFQLQVWQKLREIPWGATISYGDLAARLGKPNATRAVGQANSANPIPFIIPCHRVIKADGSLGGYSSGPEQKRWLLQHEGAMRG